MAESQDDTEKTEEPTQKRIDDAVQKGQVAFSREISNLLMLIVFALNVVWFAPYYTKRLVLALSRFIVQPHDLRLDEGNLHKIFSETIADLGIIMMLPIMATVVVAIFSSFVQNGFIISVESITPKLEKISVMKGLKRLFSMRSFVEFIKGIIKISVVGSGCYLSVRSEIPHVISMANYSIIEIVHTLAYISFKILLAACVIMGVIAILDLMYQKFEYTKSLKMSRQELKDEFKQSEGDPQIKGKLRQIRMERAKKRMMAAVPDADVVIRNPEHFAIALKYDESTMTAPVVLALGQDTLALTIIQIAEEHDIPTVTNKPLARALYKASSVDEEIPLEHYKAVAEVIGYVYRLKNKV